MFDNEIFIKLVGWLVGIIGGLLLLCWRIIVHIFRKHEENNADEFRTVRHEIERMRDHCDKRHE